ncbi:RNA polymerase sigma factor [Actinomadura oligospora]|uniref:RNA polymerase sigma factor n=1 Tax=Actinomadura oligospora TaxID=111804 RepID=UPI00047C3636|nr:sigma-70 family RNA polymerase sigma factor [Actinomadura oligospora]
MNVEAVPQPDGGDQELEALYGQLIKKHWKRLVGLCQAEGVYGAAADDIVADAFEKLHARRHAVRHKAAYLSAIVLNRLKRPGREEPRAEVEIAAASGQGPHQQMLGAEMVRAALAALTGQQHQVFALHLVGHTQAEISEALQMTPGTVRSNLRHAATGSRAGT